MLVCMPRNRRAGIEFVWLPIPSGLWRGAQASSANFNHCFQTPGILRAIKLPTSAIFAKGGKCLSTDNARQMLLRLLFKRDHTEQTVHVVVGSGSEEQLIRLAIVRSAPAELDSPKLVNLNRLACGILDRTYKLPSLEIKSIDGSGVGVVRDQKSIAQRTEILRSHRESPRLVQRFSMRKPLHERSIFAENVDVTISTARRAHIRYVELALDVLNAKHHKPLGNC